MNENITLTVIGRIPTKKNSLRRMKFGRRVKTLPSQEYVAWERMAVILFSAQACAFGISLPLKRAEVDIEITFPDRRRTDISNKIEGIMDAMVKARVIADDCWTVIPILHAVSKGYDKNKAGAKITLKEIA